MKKLVFGLVVLFGLNVSAKGGNEEAIRLEFAKGTVSFVESVRPAYSKGISFQTFKSKILTDEKGLTTEGDNLLKSAYGFLQNETSQEEILSKGNVKPMMAAFLFIKNYNDRYKSDKGDLVLFGMSNSDDTVLKVAADCKWYQVFCHLSNLWNWLVGHLDEIMTVYTAYCQIFGC